MDSDTEPMDARLQPWRICGSLCAICQMLPEDDPSIVPWRCSGPAARASLVTGVQSGLSRLDHRVQQVQMQLRAIGRAWPDGVASFRALKTIMGSMGRSDPRYAYCANRRGGWTASTRKAAHGDANIHALRNVSIKLGALYTCTLKHSLLSPTGSIASCVRVGATCDGG